MFKPLHPLQILLWLAFLLVCLLVGFGVTAFEPFARIKTINSMPSYNAGFPPWPAT